MLPTPERIGTIPEVPMQSPLSKRHYLPTGLIDTLSYCIAFVFTLSDAFLPAETCAFFRIGLKGL